MGKQNPYYLGYCPIESNNTILVCIVEKGVVDNVLMDYQKTVLFTTILMAGSILLLLPDYSTVFPDLVLQLKKQNMKKEIMTFIYRQ